MAIYPKIQSPCPHKGDLASIMDGDICRLRDRQVFDIGDLTDGERRAFIAGRTGEVCVSYEPRLRPALAAAMAAAALAAPMTAAAQTRLVEPEVIVVGAIKDPANVEYVADDADNAVPELPVVHDDGQTPQADAHSATPATDGSTSRPNLGQPVETE
ncbi:MAG: hypothetical protein ACREH4_06765 [Vitreimonas sp.]